MDLQNLIEVVTEMGLKHKNPGYTPNLPVSCPFANLYDNDPMSFTCGQPFHEKGRGDQRPSCSISINDDGHSVFKCWTCKHQGRLVHMLDRLNWLTEHDYASLLNRVAEIEEVAEARAKSEENADTVDHAGRFKRKNQEQIYAYTDAELDGFSRQVCPYLQERGIGRRTARKFGIRWGKNEGKIIFPIRDRRGNLIGIRSRSIGKKKEYRPILRFPMGKAFFGEQFMKDGLDHLLIVEGEIDAMRCWQNGFNAVATLGAHLLDGQKATLIDYMNKNPSCDVFTAFDGDKAGQEASQAIEQDADLADMEVLMLPKGEDPDSLDPDIMEDLMWDNE